MNNSSKIFKKCSGCGKVWTDRSLFISDPDVEVAGYQINFDNLQLGLFLFNHMVCKSTISMETGAFRDLYDGPVYLEKKRGTGACSGLCLHSGELKPCPARCECAYVREIIQVLKNAPKTQRDEVK